MNIDGLIFKLRDLSAVFSVLSAPAPCKIFLSDHTFGSDKFRQDAKYIPIYSPFLKALRPHPQLWDPKHGTA